MVGSFYEAEAEIWAFRAVQFMHILHLAIYDHKFADQMYMLRSVLMYRLGGP